MKDNLLFERNLELRLCVIIIEEKTFVTSHFNLLSYNERCFALHRRSKTQPKGAFQSSSHFKKVTSKSNRFCLPRARCNWKMCPETLGRWIVLITLLRNPDRQSFFARFQFVGYVTWNQSPRLCGFHFTWLSLVCITVVKNNEKNREKQNVSL